MKKSKKILLIYILNIILCSCSTEKNIVSNYIKKDIEKNKEVIIISDKFSSLETIKLLRGKISKNSYNGYKGIHELDYIKLIQTQDSTNVNNWEKKDFIIRKFNLLSFNELESSNSNLYTINKSIYSVSDLIKVPGKNIAFFYICKADNIGSINSLNIIILKKEKNNWKIIDKFKPQILY